MPAQDQLELFAPFFEDLTDPRIDRSKRHALLDIVILAVCATLGNADGWADIERFCRAKIDFFSTFLDLPNGIPSHDTFGRVFAALDSAALMACIQQWLNALGDAVAGEVVAIDGKTLRGSFDTAAGKNPLHLASAWACKEKSPPPSGPVKPITCLPSRIISPGFTTPSTTPSWPTPRTTSPIRRCGDSGPSTTTMAETKHATTSSPRLRPF
jgi:hypothetical protein